MNDASFVSPFPAVPASLSTIDVQGSLIPIANQGYIDAIASNIVNNPPNGGTFNASSMGIVINPGSDLELLQNVYGWNVIV